MATTMVRASNSSKQIHCFLPKALLVATALIYISTNSVTHGFTPNLSFGRSLFKGYNASNLQLKKRAAHGKRSYHLASTLNESDENETSDDDNEAKIDFEKISKQAKLFTEMAIPYYKESKSARYLFLGMILITFLNSGVSVAFSYVGKDFWNALSSKDPEQFYTMLYKFGGALLVGSPVSVFYRFQREKLAVSWREWMTDRTFQLYCSNRVYYSLERGSEIDNPDQRIAEDVRSFTTFSLALFLTLVTSVIDLVSFSFILYSIQPQLFVAIIAYAAFGTFTTALIGSNLVGLNYDKLLKEADFRYSLVRLRENAESVAFYAGEDIEGKEVSSRLEKVIENKMEINVAQRNLEFFTTSYNYFVQIVPVAVVAPQFFSGAIKLGVVSQSAGAFNHILSDLSVIVNQFEQLSSFSASIDRLSTFMNAIRDADNSRSESDGLLQLPQNSSLEELKDAKVFSHQISLTKGLPMRGSLEVERGASPLLSIQNVTLSTPDGKRCLIEELDLSIKEGNNLLIVGSSGTGKSSLLRAIAGLWTSGQGHINAPSDEDVYFLPQRPYCALGTLRDQLLYPSMEEAEEDDYPEGHRLSRSHFLRNSLTDDDLLSICEQIDLSDLPERAGDGDPIKGLNTVIDWSNTLSLGEQQRLAFGRLLVNQPLFVILDEATSALDMAGEAKMYALLQKMGQKNSVGNNGLTQPGLTYVSVGHRPSLTTYHSTKLRLNGGKDHSVETIEKVVETNPETILNL